jgi:hypothetical protein
VGVRSELFRVWMSSLTILDDFRNWLIESK